MVPSVLPHHAGTSAGSLGSTADANTRTYSQQDIKDSCGWGNRTIPGAANLVSGVLPALPATSTPARQAGKAVGHPHTLRLNFNFMLICRTYRQVLHAWPCIAAVLLGSHGNALLPLSRCSRQGLAGAWQHAPGHHWRPAARNHLLLQGVGQGASGRLSGEAAARYQLPLLAAAECHTQACMACVGVLIYVYVTGHAAPRAFCRPARCNVAGGMEGAKHAYL